MDTSKKKHELNTGTRCEELKEKSAGEIVIVTLFGFFTH
jgi:hypothetical protein